MKRLSYRDQQIQNYIKNTYGETKKIRFDEVGEKYRASCYFYDELEGKEIKGFPYSSDYLLKDGTSCSQERYATLSDEEKEGVLLDQRKQTVSLRPWHRWVLFGPHHF